MNTLDPLAILLHPNYGARRLGLGLACFSGSAKNWEPQTPQMSLRSTSAGLRPSLKRDFTGASLKNGFVGPIKPGHSFRKKVKNTSFPNTLRDLARFRVVEKQCPAFGPLERSC
jgi:hypothetical protein